MAAKRGSYPHPVLDRLQLIVQYGVGDRGHQAKLWQPVRQKVIKWQDFHARRTATIPALSYRDGGTFIIIRQERPDQPVQLHRLNGINRDIYLACRRPVPIKSLLSTFNSVTEQALTRFLADLERKKLMFHDRGMWLALAVRRGQSDGETGN